MARLVLVHGKDPLTRQLDEEIIASQTAEIAAMRERLAILRRGDDPDPGGFPALQGTRGEVQRQRRFAERPRPEAGVRRVRDALEPRKSS